jgi:predicted pyridoxine 5'-phosphate oxidase superfamily flavin-nucleotide-binding protein
MTPIVRSDLTVHDAKRAGHTGGGGAGVTGPFHAGERAAQARAFPGAPGPTGGGIRAHLTPQHQALFAALPFVGLAAVADGWPVATLVAGEPGFVRARDARTLEVWARLDRSDPAARALAPGAPVGLLGIELETRSRSRANGLVGEVGPAGFTVEVRQSFGNCPRYIHPRALVTAAHTVGLAEPLRALDPEARALLARADTFFVASCARAGEPLGGADLSHRGGPPGFVRVDGDVLTVPDYPGNRYLDTLGNLVELPRAGLVVPDFASGDLLHLRGDVELVWEGPDVARHPGAERLWRLRVREGVRRRGAFPLREPRAG